MKKLFALGALLLLAPPLWAEKKVADPKTETFELEVSPKDPEQFASRLSKYLTGRASIADRFTARYMAAEILFAQGHHAQAFKLYESLTTDSEASEMQKRDMSYRMAECRFHMGEYPQADKLFDTVRLFETVVKTSPGTLEGEVLYGQAVSSLANMRMDEALQRLEGLTKNYPYYGADSRLFYPLGLLQWKKGSPDKAMEFFRRDLEQPANLFFAGVTTRALHKPLEAVGHFENLAKKFPRTHWEARGRFEVAETYYQEGDYPLAQDTFDKWLEAHALTPLAPAVHYRLACIDYKLGRYSDTLKELEKTGPLKHWPALKEQTRELKLLALVGADRWSELAHETYSRTNPRDLPPDKNFERVWAQVAQGHHREARKMSEQSIAAYVDPDYTPMILLTEGFSYEQEQENAKALATYQTVIDRFPLTEAHALAVRLIAASYAKAGRYKELLSHISPYWQNLSPTYKKLVPETSFYLAEAHLELGRYKDAILAYQYFLKTVPNHALAAYAHLGLALALSQDDRMNLAFQTLQEFNLLAERQSNKDWQALSLLQTGHIFYNQKNFEQAVLSYRTFRQQNPGHRFEARALYQEGQGLYRMGYYVDAMETWKTLSSTHPQDPLSEDGLFQAARTAFDLGRSTEAVHLYETFLHQFPKSIRGQDASLQIANGLYNAGRFDEAAGAYKTFLDHYPASPETAAAQGFLQMCYLKTGRSLEEIDKLSKGQPKSAMLADVFWEKGAAAFNEKKYAEAEALFQKILLDFPGAAVYPQAAFYRAQCLFLMEKYEESAQAYSVLLTQYPQDEQAPLARFNTGISYFNVNKFEESAKAFEEFLKEHPKHELAVNAAQNVPICYARVGNPEKAEAAFQALAARTKDPAILAGPLLQLGLLYEQLAQDAKAATFYNQVAAGTAESPESLYYLASVYARLGELAKAEKVSQQLAQVKPAEQPFRILGVLRLAEFYAASGQLEKSKALYQDVAAHSQDQGVIMQAQQKLSEMTQTQ